MPTKNPRLTVTLSPAVSALLVELSKLTGESQSSIIADMLEKTAPVFDRVIKVLTAAEAAKAQLKERMASDLEEAQTRMERQLGLALDAFDEDTNGFLEQMEKVTRRARREPADGKRSASPGSRRRQLTPLSNRGVRSTANPVKTAKAKGRKDGQV